MTKKVIIFRMFSWLIGILLSLISRFIFFNDNDTVWSIAKVYNEIICIISLIPIAQVLIIIDLVRKKKDVLKHFLAMLFLLLCFLVYICVWVGCSGGI